MLRIRSFDELTESQRRTAGLIEWADFSAPSHPERADRVRVGGRPFQRYESLYALEGGVPLARVGSIRVPFRTRVTTFEACGVADVATRPDAVRRGLATALMEETHRRARAGGVPWAFLWTRRSWGAHRAYERLGYRDIYSPRIAVKRPSSAPRAPSATSRGTIRRAGPDDAATLDGIFEVATRHRIGFVPRAPRTFEARFRLGWRDPAEFWILRRGGAAVGYLHAARDRFDIISREIVGRSPRVARALLGELERLAGRRWIAIGNTTFVRDAADELRAAGYRLLAETHGTLMACPLLPEAARGWEELRRTVADARFSLHSGDMI